MLSGVVLHLEVFIPNLKSRAKMYLKIGEKGRMNVDLLS